MRAIMLMYDSLNRTYLPSYGDTKTIAPNFARLAQKTVTFDKFYVGSLPCIPARRELHTGRYNFLHRCWGPLEPFDDSAPSLLAGKGIYTHLVTDHAHYWQEGGSTYHTKFSSCEMIRGQEGDFWHGKAEGFTHKIDLHRQDIVNRKYMQTEESHPHVLTYEAGMQFLRDNHGSDNWYLQVEYFDPHEPYFVPDKYKKLYTDSDMPFDWPYYSETCESSDEVRQAQTNYRAVVSMLDNYLGKVLDFMDEHDMWKDTMLIVNTDHGYMLGENGFFGKNYMPTYDQIAHTPFFMWDPRTKYANERRSQLSQSIDIAPTLLEYFNVEKPKDMLGQSLSSVMNGDNKIHDYIMYGYFGKHVNITDGRYVYMRSGRSAADGLLNNYTIVPLHMFEPFSLKELRNCECKMVNDYSFTKGVPVMRIPANDETSPQNTCYMYSRHLKYGDLLFDLETDPSQHAPIKNDKEEERLTAAMKKMLQENEAPAELYERIGF